MILNKDQWNELLTKVNDGETVAELAKLYGVSEKTIYNKVGKTSSTDSSLLEINKLKKEVKSLREVLGYVTAELSKEKKLL
jgi:transcriptional antiterminator